MLSQPGSRPIEVVVQHNAERILGDAHVGQGLVETGDRTTIHLGMLPVAGVHPKDVRLVTHRLGVSAGSPERFTPIRGKPLEMVRVLSRM